MPTDLAVVFADSHLQERTWKLRPILGDSYFSFQQIVDYAIKHNISRVIGAGDLIDKRVNEPGPIVFLTRQLERLHKKQISFLYIQGQHELDRETPWMGVGRCASHIHGREFSIGTMGLYGLDYLPSGKLQEALNEIPESCSVLIAHQVWEDFMGERALPQGAFADIPGHIKLLITGDYHKNKLPDKKHRNKAGERLAVFSPGATYQTTIDEPSECSFGVLESDGVVRRVKLRTRKFDEFSFTTEHDIEVFLGDFDAYLEGAADYAEANTLPKDLHTPLWRIVYNHRLADIKRRIDAAVGDRAHLFYKEIPPAQEDNPDPVKTKLAKMDKSKALTLESCLASVVDAKEDPKEFALCERLLGTADPVAELAAWKAEALA